VSNSSDVAGTTTFYDDAETAVTSNTSNLGVTAGSHTPNVKSLELECSTLKEIIRVDSVSILKLKTSHEKLRHDAAKLKHELEYLKKDRDLLREREAQHRETIRVLKKELDTVTQIGAMSSPEAQKELEQLRIENELFATQIIENEVRELSRTFDIRRGCLLTVNPLFKRVNYRWKCERSAPSLTSWIRRISRCARNFRPFRESC